MFFCRFSDLGPKWSRKALNGLIIVGNYSHAPYGDFWNDSGTICFDQKNMETSRSLKTDVFLTYNYQKCRLYKWLSEMPVLRVVINIKTSTRVGSGGLRRVFFA